MRKRIGCIERRRVVLCCRGFQERGTVPSMRRVLLVMLAVSGLAGLGTVAGACVPNGPPAGDDRKRAASSEQKRNRAVGAAALPKLREARARIDASGLPIRLEIDGGVKPDNIRAIAAAGADTFVAGSAVFGKADYRATIAALRAEIAAAGQA